MTSINRVLALAAFIALAANSAGAQRAANRADPNCTYQTCALGLVPVWNGIEITRGDAQRRVAMLGFFIPEDVSRAFAEDAEAVDVARDAFRIRQIGAALTDGGIVLAATGLARALFRRDWDALSTGLTVGGGVALAAGVPFQFAADGALSRAVWLFNRRYSR